VADKRFEPQMESSIVRQYVKGWKRALKTAMFWGK
jgi:glycerol kinase